MPVPVAIAAAAVLAACSASVAWTLACRAGLGRGARRFPLAVLAVLLVAWSSAAVLAAVPLVVLCATAWAAFALAFCLASDRPARGLFAANLVFSCFAVSLLLAFSAASVVTGGVAWQVLEDDALRPAVVAAGLALFCAAGMAFWALLGRFPLVEHGGRSSAVLFWYGWFVLGYILLDALPSLFRLDVPLLSEFLGASMLLLGVSVVAFAAATSRLGRDAHLEEEYLALVELRDRQEERLDRLRDQAYRDALTGLVSRRAGIEAAKNLLAQGRPFAVVYLDMNGLKAVNDAHGHEAGDACLVRLADALRASFPRRATVCRMSGDEFLAVLPDGSEREAAESARKALASLASQPVDGIGRVSFSFGTASGRAGESAADLVGRADRAMYRGKRAYHARAGGDAR